MVAPPVRQQAFSDSGGRGSSFMSVLELCDKDVASVRVEVSAADAIRLMLDRHVGRGGCRR